MTVRRNALRVLLAAVVVLGLLEAVLRLLCPVPEAPGFNRIEYSEILSPGLRGRRALMHAATTWTSEPDGASFVNHLNLYGFRDGDWSIARREGVPRVLVVGDSFVEGFMAEDDETMTVAFREACRAAGQEVEVLNLGVGGIGMERYLPLIRDAVPLFSPDEVVLVLYANDLPTLGHDRDWLASAPVLEPRPAWAPRLAWVARQLLGGQPVPLRGHSAPFPFLAPVPDPSNPWTENGALYATQVDREMADAMRRATFNPNVVNLMGRFEIQLRAPFDVRDPVIGLERFCGEHGARFSLAYLPYKLQVSDRYLPFERRLSPRRDITSLLGEEYQAPARNLRQLCQIVKVPFLDLTPVLRAAEETGRALYWEHDEHMRAEGYGLVGATLAEWWRSRP